MKIEIRDFLTPRITYTCELPDRGVVLVTGRNGSGKSTRFVESFGVALYGKTTRGVTPPPGYTAAVEIGALRVERVHNKREAVVSVYVDGSPIGQSEGATKAQPTINSWMGCDFKTWHRTCVFSMEKVVRFSTARDGERKEMLEGLLGLGRFDSAVKLIRLAQKSVEERVTKRSIEIGAQRRLIESAKRDAADFEDAMEVRDDEPTIEQLKSDLAGWNAAFAQRGGVQQKAVTAAELADKESREAYAELASARAAVAEADKALVDEACPACGRSFGVTRSPEELAHLNDRKKAAAARLVAASTRYGRATNIQTAASATRSIAERDMQEATQAARELRASIVAAEKRAVQDAQNERRLGALQERVAHLYDQLSELEAAALVDGEESDVLRGAELVLGLRGARARLLTAGLNALETNANYALSVMGASARLKLAAFSTKSDGNVSDTIGLDIEALNPSSDPWGGADGYDGASVGQRKRIDVALLIGVSEMYQPPEALGCYPPLLLDDVFDSLDPEGHAAVGLLLTELSKQRTVVLITQRNDLADMLSGDAVRIDL